MQSIKPGALVAIFVAQDPDLKAIEARKAGLQLRDTILVVGPTSVSFILLLRNPGARTHIEDVIAHGTGVLNVEACRLPPTREDLGGGRGNPYARWSETGEERNNEQMFRHGKMRKQKPGLFERYGTQEEPHVATEGRWPPNVLFCGREGPKYYPSFPDMEGVKAWVATLLGPSESRSPSGTSRGGQGDGRTSPGTDRG